MANIYVSAAGSSTSPFDTWAKAGSLTSALGVAAAGDDVWVASTHSEITSSAVTYTFPGTNASPNRCIVASTTSGNAPPLSADLVSSASASVASATSGALSVSGDVYFRGVIFNAGTSTGASNLNLANAAGNFQKYELCTLNQVGTGVGQNIILSQGNAETWLVNTSVSFGNTGNGMFARGRHIWQNGSITGAIIPNTLFATTTAGTMIVEGTDLSPVTGTIIANITGGPSTFYFKDCKLNAGASVLPATSITTAGLGGPEAYVVRCDSGATTYRQEKHNYCADLIQNISITRNGGATDGTTPISWQITTTANAKWYNNFQSFPISIWNNTVGSTVNVTVHATSNLAAGAFPNNNDIWIEAEFLGSGSTPLGSFTTNTISNVLTTATAYTSDSNTWLNPPAGGTFAMTVAITPQMAGPITVYVRCAKTSTIFYVDPLIVLS